MKTTEELKRDLYPFLVMIKTAKAQNCNDFLDNVDDFKNYLIKKNICGVKENPLLLDRFVDEIIEE